MSRRGGKRGNSNQKCSGGYYLLRAIVVLGICLAVVPLERGLRASSSPASASSSVQPHGDSFRRGQHYGRPALILSNGVLELTVLEMGGALAKLLLKDDEARINPMWDGYRSDREKGQPERPNGMVGHFSCVDGFGPVSDDEKAAGFPSIHGEAAWLPWVTQTSKKEHDTQTLVQTVYLPRVQEVLTRTLQMVDGENIIYVKNTLDNLLDFDRPVCWAEHGTIGSPFLKAGVTVVDLSQNRAITRSRDIPMTLPHRLASDKEFTWPTAPTVDDTMVDLRPAPQSPESTDWTAHLWSKDREWSFVTALNPELRLMLGYVFKTSDYPWLQIWEHYPPEGMMARGLEFGSQAFDRSRRNVITANRLLGELLYRWLPAKSRIKADFILFWTRTPEGFLGTDEIELSDGQLHITDRRSGTQFSLKASRASQH